VLWHLSSVRLLCYSILVCCLIAGMGKSLHRTCVFALLTFMVAESIRKKIDTSVTTSGTTKCTAGGQSGKATGLSISWPVEKPIIECGLARRDQTEGLTYEFKFSEAFEVSFEKKCDCKIEGKTIVSFKAKNMQEANECKDNIMTAKRQCWAAYMRGRGTTFHKVGPLSVPEYQVPWMSGNFVVEKGPACEGAECYDIKVPGVLASMDRDGLRIIGGAIKQIIDGNVEKVPKALIKMIDILPTEARDDAEFEQIDEDGDTTLTIDELTNYFDKWDSKLLEQFVGEIDANGNGSVDKPEFYEFKQKMRDYNPMVDLIDGPIDFMLSPKSGKIKEILPEWKVETVVCKKGGVPVGEEECDNMSKEDAIIMLNEGC